MDTQSLGVPTIQEVQKPCPKATDESSPNTSTNHVDTSKISKEIRTEDLLPILRRPADASDSQLRLAFDLNNDDAGEKRSVTIDDSEPVMIDFPRDCFEFDTTKDDTSVELQLEKTDDQYDEIPDGGWGWIVVLGAFLLNVIIIGTHNVFGLIFIDLDAEFRDSLFKTSLVGSIAFGCILIFGPLGGILANIFGSRKVTLAGSAIAAGSLFVSSYASSVDVLFFTYGVAFGLGTSLAYMQGIVMVSQYFSTHRALATGVVFSGSSLGTFVMAPIYNVLTTHLGWRLALRSLAGIVSITLLSGMTYRKLRRPIQENRTIEERMRNSPAGRFIIDLSLWKNKAFVTWAVSVGLFKLGYLVPYVHLVKYAEDIGAERDFGSNLLGIMGITSAVSRITYGRISDSPKVNRLHLSQGTAFVTGLMNILLPSLHSESGLLLYVIVIGLLDGGIEILLPVMTLDLVGPEKMTIAWGCLLAVISASACGPPIAGAIRDNQENYAGAFYFAGSPMLACSLVLLLIPLWATKQSQEPAKSYLSIDPSKLEIPPYDSKKRLDAEMPASMELRQ